MKRSMRYNSDPPQSCARPPPPVLRRQTALDSAARALGGFARARGAAGLGLGQAATQALAFSLPWGRTGTGQAAAAAPGCTTPSPRLVALARVGDWRLLSGQRDSTPWHRALLASYEPPRAGSRPPSRSPGLLPLPLGAMRRTATRRRRIGRRAPPPAGRTRRTEAWPASHELLASGIPGGKRPSHLQHDGGAVRAPAAGGSARGGGAGARERLLGPGCGGSPARARGQM